MWNRIFHCKKASQQRDISLGKGTRSDCHNGAVLLMAFEIWLWSMSIVLHHQTQENEKDTWWHFTVTLTNFKCWDISRKKRQLHELDITGERLMRVVGVVEKRKGRLWEFLKQFPREAWHIDGEESEWGWTRLPPQITRFSFFFFKMAVVRKMCEMWAVHFCVSSILYNICIWDVVNMMTLALSF